MTARTYIQAADIPRPLLDTAARRVDGTQQLVAFIGCPITGTEVDDEIEFPFPRSPEIRDSLINWLCHWGLSFRVEM
ncbi:hypothetical protein B0G84_5004 [Paraburkholderia sp. BL8N3]|nr:hypothetical protein [Paraburkholderia sp. BL8N3]TCK39664.1 hypothetical protein B0G84_5004 [Paraburkholderia sp. BL8N3]